MRVAETRAVNRALRKAYGIGICSVEALGAPSDPVPREVLLDVDLEDSGCLVNLLSQENSDADASGKHRLLLEPYGYRWFRVGGLDYILKRSQF